MEQIDYLPDLNQIKLGVDKKEMMLMNNQGEIFKDYQRVAPDRENVPQLKDLFNLDDQLEKHKAKIDAALGIKSSKTYGTTSSKKETPEKRLEMTHIGSKT